MTALELVTVTAASWTFLAVAAGIPVGRWMRRADRPHIYLPELPATDADWLADQPTEVLTVVDRQFYAIVDGETWTADGVA